MAKIKVKGQTVQTGECPQTNGRTHGRYQTYYCSCYVVDKYIVEYLNKKNWLSVSQHGFVNCRSCLTKLLEAFEAWTRLLDKGHDIDIISLDYHKAFDIVGLLHSCPLVKLV